MATEQIIELECRKYSLEEITELFDAKLILMIMSKPDKVSVEFSQFKKYENPHIEIKITIED